MAENEKDKQEQKQHRKPKSGRVRTWFRTRKRVMKSLLR